MKDLTSPPDVDTITLCPIAETYLHPLNPRQAVSPDSVRELADAILAEGLMENLQGFADPDQAGMLGIVGGGRRWRALNLLHTEGKLGDGPVSIPLKVTDDPLVAASWAGAGNATHKPPHPVDEVRSYSQLADKGATVRTIATAFATTERHVNQRLRLAGLHPDILDALRSGEINLDEAAAMTTIDDHIAVLAILDQCRGRGWGAPRIRAALQSDNIQATDRRAVFVGLDAYCAAGGAISDDLFAESQYLQDEKLLATLFDQALKTEADRAQDQDGWKWVWYTPGNRHDDPRLKKTTAQDPTPVGLPDGDAHDLEELSEIPRWKLDDDQAEQLEQLELRARGTFDERERARLGCFLFVDHKGRLQAWDGLLHDDDKAAPETDGTAPAATTKQPATEDEGPAISAALLEDLHTIRLHAAQTALLAKPELVLDLLAYALSQGTRHYPRIFNINPGYTNITPSIDDGLLQSKRLANPVDDESPASQAAFDAFQKRGKKRRNELLTTSIVRQLNHRRDGFLDTIEDLAGANIRAIWTPTTANFFGRIKGPGLDVLYVQLLQPDGDCPHHAAFAKLKVKEKARELGDLFSDASVQEAYGLNRETISRLDTWLPPEMQAAS